MATTSTLEVKNLNLDLKNYRTTIQKKEADAIKAMIAIKPDRFFAVMDSLIEDGYLPTENLIVLKDGDKFIVKEGNRRVAALKLIHGLHKFRNFGLPAALQTKIENISAGWKKDNLKVPCTIFNASESEKVDRIVTLAHGKGEKASRDPWNSVARARHNRDVKQAAEPALDLLEKYLKVGQNLTGQQKDRWGGEFPLTVLNEAISKIYNRFGVASAVELAQKYPKINLLSELESMIREIGLEMLETREIRNTTNGNDFALRYNIPPITPPPASTSTSPSTTPSSSASSAPAGGTTTNSQGGAGATSGNNPRASTNTNSSNSSQSSSANGGGGSGTQGSQPSATAPPRAVASNDPKHVTSLLKKFAPRGQNRQKVVLIRDEMKKLKMDECPVAFCLLLRSIFEISAKAYAVDHNIPTAKSGKDKRLVDLLRDITNHLTSNNTDVAKVKLLHGAMAEMGKNDGILSITSMNQLVHNPGFSVTSKDICTIFGNIYPLLEFMN